MVLLEASGVADDAQSNEELLRSDGMEEVLRRPLNTDLRRNSANGTSLDFETFQKPLGEFKSDLSAEHHKFGDLDQVRLS